MSSAKITLIGLNNHYDLFKDLILPEGIDKDTLVDNILLRGGEFETLYSDPEFIAGAIKIWSRKWQHTFDKWIKAINLEYNPLDNYDRVEEWTTTDDGSNTGSSNSTDASKVDTINKVSAYNSNDLENNNSTSSDATNSSTNTTTGTNKNINIRTGRAHGNIGVTTSMQLIESELQLAYWNIYEHITDIFLSEFVIPIY